MHIPTGPIPAGRLTMTHEARASFATFAYGRRYLERTDRAPVDPVQFPFPIPEPMCCSGPKRASPTSMASATPRPTGGATI